MKKGKAELRRREIEKALMKEVGTIYTPGDPITDPCLFSGRNEILDHLRGQLQIKGMNFVFYGERGVGKTSFCNTLFSGYRIQRHNCSKRDDFVTVFLNILSNLGEQFTEDECKLLKDAGYSIGSDNILSVREKLGMEETVRPVAVQRLDLNFVLKKLAKMQNQLDVIVFDEFQNIENPEIQTEIIEVVKGLADKNIETRIAIVGVACSDTNLLTTTNYPQYKLRHFTAERIPKMHFEELIDIINKREILFKIKFEPDVKNSIARISSGYPSYVHKLALYSCFKWILDYVVAVSLSILSLIPIIGEIFSSRKPRIERVGFDIKTENLIGALRLFTAEFEKNYPDTVKQYTTAIKSSDKEIVQQILLLFAKSQFEEIRGKKIASMLGVDEKKIISVVENSLNVLIRKLNEHNYGLTFPQIKPFILSLEYLQHKGSQVY